MSKESHQAHRYGAPKASSWMIKYQDGDITSNDLLLHFVRSLPNVEPVGSMRRLGNKFGGNAQHFVYHTVLQSGPDSKAYWHGTTYHCLPDILARGMKNPFDHTPSFQ